MIRRNPDIAALVLLALLLLPASFRREILSTAPANQSVRLVSVRTLDRLERLDRIGRVPERVGVRIVQKFERLHEKLSAISVCPFNE